MNAQPFPAWGALAAAVLALAWPASALGQITINASDMFNKAGQFWEGYEEKNAPVTGLLGSPSSTPQAWDFTVGPTGTVVRFDYLDVAEAPENGLFPGATLAERKSDPNGFKEDEWLYFDQVPGVGRVVHGFYSPSSVLELLSSSPAMPFLTPARDFPETIGYGDSWTIATEIDSDIGGDDTPEDDPFGAAAFLIPLRITYNASSTVDAFGVINLPGIGFGECLRVNELVQWDVSANFGDGFQSFGTVFVRNYYWLRKGHGIVAIVVKSSSAGTPPPNDFPVADSLVRMFNTNHDEAVVEIPKIQGLKMTLGKDGALLQWTKAAGITQYRVEYTAAIGQGWQPLVESTSANFTVDSAAGKPGTPARLYRVVGLN